MDNDNHDPGLEQASPCALSNNNPVHLRILQALTQITISNPIPPPSPSAPTIPLSIIHLGTSRSTVTKTNITTLIPSPISLTRSTSLLLRLHLLITRRPSTREEPSPHSISRPTNTAARTTLLLTMTARRLPNLLIKRTSRTRDTREHSPARTPQHSMRSTNLEARPFLNALVGDSHVPSNARKQRRHVVCHVGVILVVFLRVGGFGQHSRFFFVAARGVRVQASVAAE